MNNDVKFIYNVIDEQKLLYARELTIRHWNFVINSLRKQTNDTTHYLETLHKFMFGDAESLTPFIEDMSRYPSFYEYVYNNLLKKVNTVQTVYSVDLAGLQKNIRYSPDMLPGSIVQRDNSGRIKIEPPVENNDAANKAYVDAQIQNLIDQAPTDLDTFKEIADNLKTLGHIKNIEGIFTEEQITLFWDTLEEGIYTITSQMYGKELIIISHQSVVDGEVDDLGNAKDPRLFKRMTGGYDYTYDFELNDWVIASGGGGGGGTGGPSSSILFKIEGSMPNIIARGSSIERYCLFRSSAISTGYYELYINTTFVNRGALTRGSNNKIVFPSERLNLENNAIEIRVYDDYGNSIPQPQKYMVKTVELDVTVSKDVKDPIIINNAFGLTYNVSGEINKKVIFTISGESIDTIVDVQEITTTRDQTYTINVDSLPHGVYTLKIKAEAAIDDNEYLYSEELVYNIIRYVPGNNNVLIASRFDEEKTIKQDEPLFIDYTVYDPSSEPTTVELITIQNDLEPVVIERNVYRTKQPWDIYGLAVGTALLSIKCKDTIKTFNITVQEPNVHVPIKVITDNIVLNMETTNRANTDLNKDWTSADGSVKAELEGFSWGNTNGWVSINGRSILRLNNDASAYINFYPFSKDLASSGKTIELEFATSNVYDITKPLITCMYEGIGFTITSNDCIFSSKSIKSEESITKFKEDVKIKISFVINPKEQLFKIFLDGVCSKVLPFSSNDTFKQDDGKIGISINPKKIVDGNNINGTIDIYSIRVYDAALVDDDIITNYIADLPSNEKFMLYNINNITNTVGDVQYQQLLDTHSIPIITVIGKLPVGENDKNRVLVKYESNLPNSPSFEYMDSSRPVILKVQGTSSLTYPIKNIKFEFPEAFSFYDGAVPEKIYTFKADYMESSHSHNTGNAIIADRFSPTFLEQFDDNDNRNTVRNAIYGFPVVLFQKDTATSVPKYIGVYNFNNDKGNYDTLGLKGNAESWEFNNNQNGRCMFAYFWTPYYRLVDGNYILVSDYIDQELMDETEYYRLFDPVLKQLLDKYIDKSTYLLNPNAYTIDVFNDFEARYPKDNQNYEKLSKIITWVASLNPETATGYELEGPYDSGLVIHTHDTAEYRLDYFKNNFKNYFDLDYCLYYYIMLDLFLAVDSRAKNMFLDYINFDKNKFLDNLNEEEENENITEVYRWCPRWYDIDSTYGLTNEGYLSYTYSLNQQDVINNKPVYNGKASVFWNMFETVFKSEINLYYRELRRSLTYDSMLDILKNHQTDKISATLYNTDNIYKYIEPYKRGKNYLYAGQGTRMQHLQWWLYNRFRYEDSVRLFDDYIEDYISIKSNTPDNVVVPANSLYELTPYIDINLTINFDDTSNKSTKGYANTKSVIDLGLPLGSSGTVVKIYGASNLLDIGDLSSKYIGLLDVSRAVKLKKIVIGNSAPGYKNDYFTSLSIGNAEHPLPLLEEVNVTNCVSLSGKLDFSYCSNIKNVEAFGTSISEVVFPDGGNIQILELPSTINVLYLKNQSSLYSCMIEGYTNLQRVMFINSYSKYSINIIKGAIDYIQYLRLEGIEWTLQNNDQIIIDKLCEKQFLDINGNILNTFLDEPSYAVTGTITILGDVAEDYVQKWRNKFPKITFNCNAVPAYTVVFKNWNGEKLYETFVLEGHEAIYDGPVPTKESEDYEYIFNGWDKDITSITNDIEVTAQFLYNEPTLITFLFTNPMYMSPTIQVSGVRYGESVTIDWGVDKIAPIVYTQEKATSFINCELPQGYPALNTKFTASVLINHNSMVDCRVTIPDNLYSQYTTEINYSGRCTEINAPFEMTNLSKITVPKSITSLQFKAPNLTEFYYKGTVKDWCTNLTTISYSHTSKSDYYFLDEHNEYQKLDEELVIPEGVTKLVNGVFTYIWSIRTITLPKSLQYIASNAFHSNNNKIKTLYYNSTDSDWLRININSEILNDTITNINVYVLNQNKEYYQPTTITVPEDVTSISSYAFYKWRTLSSIQFHRNITYIGRYAFYYCTGLTSVVIPDSVISIGLDAFASCKNLSNVTLSKSLTEISSSLFAKCDSLYSITIPQGVQTINSYAFDTCANLQKIYIPSSISSISSWAFYYCNKLSKVYYSGTVEDWCKLSTHPRFHTKVDFYISNNYVLLKDVNIPETITELKSYIFNYFSITSVVMHDNITKIGSEAFNSCTSLKTVELPSSLTSIDGSTFAYCSALTDIILPENLKDIGSYAFRNSGINTITIPGNVDSIGAHCFSNCTKLHTVVLNNKLKLINKLFPECNALQNITIGLGITSVSSSSFNNCSNMKNVYYNGSIEEWCNIAFESTTACPFVSNQGNQGDFYILDNTGEYSLVTEINLTSLDTLSKINDYTFYGFTSITKLVLSDNISEIGANAFYRCKSLANVYLGNSLETIGYGAFSGCTSLIDLTIPTSVTQISNYALAIGNATTKNVVMTFDNETPPSLASSTVFLYDALLNIKVPAISLDLYRGATVFSVVHSYDPTIIIAKS